MYSDPEQNSKKYMVGLSFVTPEFDTPEEKDDYLRSKDSLMKYVAQKEQELSE